MASVLDRIFADKRLELEQRRRAVGFDEVRERAAQAPAPRGFVAALAHRRPAIIAEIKRASPSKGDILPGTRSGNRRRHLRRRWRRRDFGVDRRSLQRFARRSAGGALPRSICRFLRKDFIFDAYQIHEARAAGADCILLILAMLAQQQARELKDLATGLGMAVLVEVHDRAELESAEAIGARLIGINNRDLHTFKTDIAVTEELLAAYRGDALIVSESGIETPADIRRLFAAGARAFLIGESLLRGGDPSRRLSALTGALDETAAGGRVG